MRRLMLSLSLAGSCTALACDRDPGDAWSTLRRDGIGPVSVGMPLPALNAQLGDTMRIDTTVFERCGYVYPAAAPAGISLMVIDDTVRRVDIDTVGIQTVEGAMIGDEEARILELYKGRVTVRPHPYTGPVGHYLIVDEPADTVHRLIFETDGKHVTTMRGGERRAVNYIEGCA